jgi:cellobiose phosphorylase
VERSFRGASYDITIENPQGKSRGTIRLTVDGAPVEGNLVKPHRDGKTHKVVAVLE